MDNYIKDLDYEYTCKIKYDSAVPPPWDRTLNVRWSRLPRGSKEVQDDDVEAFKAMTALNTRYVTTLAKEDTCTTTGLEETDSTCHQDPSESPREVGQWGYFTLPANVALKICRYIVQQHSTDKPIRLSRLSVYTGLYPIKKDTLLVQGTEREIWESEFFETQNQALRALAPYLQVNRGFRADLQAALFLTRRYHLVISPFGPATNIQWLAKYGRHLKNITMEFDCTRFYGGKPRTRERIEAATYSGVVNKQQLKTALALGKDAWESVEHYKWVLNSMLKLLTCGRQFPVNRLTIMVRKYYGSRESMPQGYPYFDPTWLDFLLDIPSALQSNVLNLETIGVPPRLLGLIINKFWGDGKPPTEDAQRRHFTWSPSPSTLWPEMSGQSAAISIRGSVDLTADYLLRLDRPGEVEIRTFPGQEAQKEQQEQQSTKKKRKSKRKKKTKKPCSILPKPQPEPQPQPEPELEPVVEHEEQQSGEQAHSQPPPRLSVMAPYLTFVRAKEDEAEAVEEQHTTTQHKPLSRRFNFTKPGEGEGEAGPSGSATATATATATAAAVVVEADDSTPQEERSGFLDRLGGTRGLGRWCRNGSGVRKDAEPAEPAEPAEQDQQKAQQIELEELFQRARDNFMELSKLLEAFAASPFSTEYSTASGRGTLSTQTGLEVARGTLAGGFIPLLSPLRQPSTPLQPVAQMPATSAVSGPAIVPIPIPDGKRTRLTDEDSQPSSAGSTTQNGNDAGDLTDSMSRRCADTRPAGHRDVFGTSSPAAAGTDTRTAGTPRAGSSAALIANESKTTSAGNNTTTGAAAAGTAGTAAVEDKDKGRPGLWETDDTTFSVEKEWTLVEKKKKKKKKKKKNGKQHAPPSQTQNKQSSSTRKVQTSLQNLKEEWAATAGESSKTKQDLKKAKSVAGPQTGHLSKKGENKKASENKCVKSGGTSTSASSSKESGSKAGLPQSPQAARPSPSPPPSDLHIAGSNLGELGRRKAEDKDGKSRIATTLTAKKVKGKTSVGSPPFSSLELQMPNPNTSKLKEEFLSNAAQAVEEELSKKNAIHQDDLKGEEKSGTQSPPELKLPPPSEASLPTPWLSMEVPGLQPTLPEKGESQSQTRSPPQSPSDRPPPLENSLQLPMEVPKERPPLPDKGKGRWQPQLPPQSRVETPLPLETLLQIPIAVPKVLLPKATKVLEVPKGEALKASGEDVKAEEGVAGNKSSTVAVKGEEDSIKLTRQVVQDWNVPDSTEGGVDIKDEVRWAGTPTPPGEDKEVESTKVESKPASRPQPQLQLPSLQPKTKTVLTVQVPKPINQSQRSKKADVRKGGFGPRPPGQPQLPSVQPKTQTTQVPKKIIGQERIKNGHVRTTGFPPRPQGQPQRQQGHLYPGAPSQSTSNPPSQQPLLTEPEAKALYYRYLRHKLQTLDMLPTMAGSQCQMSMTSQAPTMSQAPSISQGQVPVMHPLQSTSQMPTMSQVPPTSQMPTTSCYCQVPTMSQAPMICQVPAVPQVQMQPMAQMQPIIHNHFYSQVPTTTMPQVQPTCQCSLVPTMSQQSHVPTAIMSGVPLNPLIPPFQPTFQVPPPSMAPAGHHSQPMYPFQPSYQAPQSMYPGHERCNAQRCYQETPEHFHLPNVYQLPARPMNPEVFEVARIPLDEIQNVYPREGLPSQNAYPVPKAPIPNMNVTAYPAGSGSGSGSGSGHRNCNGPVQYRVPIPAPNPIAERPHWQRSMTEPVFDRTRRPETCLYDDDEQGEGGYPTATGLGQTSFGKGSSVSAPASGRLNGLHGSRERRMKGKGKEVMRSADDNVEQVQNKPEPEGQ